MVPLAAAHIAHRGTPPRPAARTSPPAEVVSVDALVGFGPRTPGDPRILNTVKAIDAELKIETYVGSIWHRNSADRFGEHDDGSPFDTVDKGCGRAWPLLIGERAITSCPWATESEPCPCCE